MSYYFSTQTDLNFEDAITRTTEALKKEGFGVLTEIDVKATLKNKIDVDFPKYKILGACNPQFAHKALLSEEHIGAMLPCNVVVRENKARGSAKTQSCNRQYLISTTSKAMQSPGSSTSC